MFFGSLCFTFSCADMFVFFQGWASRLQGLAAGVAAGSLLFTALTELLPEASSLGNHRAGTLVIMSAVLMMIIDAFLH